jgi:hypothetical protein
MTSTPRSLRQKLSSRNGSDADDSSSDGKPARGESPNAETQSSGISLETTVAVSGSPALEPAPTSSLRRTRLRPRRFRMLEATSPEGGNVVEDDDEAEEEEQAREES